MFCVFARLLKPKKIFLWTHGWYGKETTLESIIKIQYKLPNGGIFTYGEYARDLMIKEGFKANKFFLYIILLPMINRLK